MRFHNALLGIQRIRKSMILSIWGAVAGAAILPAAAVGSLATLPVLLLSLAFLGLSLAALILELMGVSRAARDQERFDDAQVLIIVCIVLAFIQFLIPQESIFYALLELVGSLLSLRVSLLIIRGIMELAELWGWGSLMDQGRRLRAIVLLSVLGSALLSLLNNVTRFSAKSPTLAILIAVALLALSIVELVLMLRYLADAITMLSSPEPNPRPQAGAPGSGF